MMKEACASWRFIPFVQDSGTPMRKRALVLFRRGRSLLHLAGATMRAWLPGRGQMTGAGANHVDVARGFKHRGWWKPADPRLVTEKVCSEARKTWPWNAERTFLLVKTRIRCLRARAHATSPFAWGVDRVGSMELRSAAGDLLDGSLSGYCSGWRGPFGASWTNFRKPGRPMSARGEARPGYQAAFDAQHWRRNTGQQGRRPAEGWEKKKGALLPDTGGDGPSLGSSLG